MSRMNDEHRKNLSEAMKKWWTRRGGLSNGATPADLNVHQNGVFEKAGERSQSKHAVCSIAPRPAHSNATIGSRALVRERTGGSRRCSTLVTT